MLSRLALVATLVGPLAVVWPCVGFGQPAPVVVPRESSLELRRYIPEPQIAEFRGTVRVRGTFQLGWSMDGGTPLELELRFVPSPAGWASLPTFEGQTITEADYIRIRNARAAGGRLVGKRRFSRVASRATSMESGEAELVLTNIELANECGFHFAASSVSSKPLSIQEHHAVSEFKPHC